MRNLNRFALLSALVFCVISFGASAAGWAPAEGPLATRWTKDVTPKNALPEYPRPQMTRSDWMNLNGLWEYAIQKIEDPRPASFDGEILVPYPVESALSGVMKQVDDTHLLWYRREFSIPKSWAGRRVLLHFGAVDWEAQVWVNGKLMADHMGGYDPFTCDITEALRKSGNQEITVRVFDPTDKGPQPRGKQVLSPEGIYYTPTTGIWRTVWIEPVPETYISNLKITPDVDRRSVDVIVNSFQKNVSAHVELSAPSGGALKLAASGGLGKAIRIIFPKKTPMNLWSPNNPFLYDLRIKLMMGGKVVDTVRSYVGMRKISIAKDAGGTPRIFLNNAPLFMHGVLDQGFWPDGLYTAPTDAALRFDIESILSLGFNMARKHVKVEPDRWYYWCDRLGLIVWQDMPSGDAYPPNGAKEIQRTDESAGYYNHELRAMIDSLYNHPSVVMWIPFNESWGQFDTVRVTDWVKMYDPSRLVDNASGWNDMGRGDVHDIHSYPEPNAPPIETHRAAVVGEYGGLGFTVGGHNWREGMARIEGKNPESGRNWGYRDFKESEPLLRQYKSLMTLLERLIRWKGLSAAVYTQITDVEIEVNGLFSYDRDVLKYNRARIKEANNRLYGMIAKGQNERALTVIPTAQEDAGEWRFSVRRPEDNWAAAGFSDTDWRSGKGGFGMMGVNNRIIGSQWSTKQIWLRRAFDVDRNDCREPLLSVYHDGDYEAFINGVPAVSAKGSVNAYELIDIDPRAAAAIHSGKNVLAVTCRSAGGNAYIDAGLSVVCGTK